jgi:transposase InsO family protein
MRLAKNAVLEWTPESSSTPPRRERILSLEYTGDRVILYDIDAPNAWPTEASRKVLEQALRLRTTKTLLVDPYDHLSVRDEDIEIVPARERTRFEGYGKKRDATYKKLAPALEGKWGDLLDPDQRPGIIDRLVKHTCWSRQTVTKYLRRWWECGQIKNAFLSHYKNCGAPGVGRMATEPGGKKLGRPTKAVLLNRNDHSRNVFPEDIIWLKSVVLPLYEKHNRIDFAAAYRTACKERYSEIGFNYDAGTGFFLAQSLPDSIPISLNQASYHCEKLLNKEQQATKRHGNLTWPLEYRPILGDSSSLLIGPGAVYQIDATVLDLYAVSSIDRKHVIGRPVLYVVMDVFSRMVVGFAVLLEGPNWEGAKQALLHAYVDKTKQFQRYEQKYQLPISTPAWPSQYLPATLLADNGELKSILSDELQGALGITVQNPPAYRPDWKAIVERHFRTVSEYLQFTPGYVHDLSLRGGPDYRLDAKLTLQALRAFLANRFLRYNTLHRLITYERTPWMIEDGVEPYPAQLWRWGLQNSNATPRQLPEERVMATLLPSGEGTLTPRGIEFNGLHYTCAMAEDDQWFVRYRRRPGHIPLSWNPADPQHIYLRLNNGQDIVQCQLVDRAREHNLGEADWGDILDYLTVKTIEDKHAFLPDLIREIPFDQHADQIIQQETELSEIAQKGHTTASRLKGMKGVRAVEARVDQLGQLTTERQTDPASSSDDDNEYVGKPLFLQSPSTPKELPNAH